MNDFIPQLVKQSLLEDMGSGDITAELLKNEKMRANIIAREPAIVCGIEFANEVYRQIDSNVQLDWQVKEGELVCANQIWVKITGPASSIVTGERTALNWLQTLSGTATTTHEYVLQLKGSRTTLLDTRKTIPGLRRAQKYAVKIGGAENHRMGLYDAFLIKENHIASCGSIKAAALRARELYSDKKLEIEVENLSQLDEALACDVDVIMLDNFDLAMMQVAVVRTQGRVKLEVSGNVSVNSLAEIAATGVDYISVGALTKHLRAIDLSMRFVDF